jgi:UDP-glucose 4-epimerase
MSEPTKALVTGGAGFIGSHLVDRLLDCGHAVAVVDNLTTGQLRNVNHHAVFYHAELNDPKIEQIVQRERPEIVFHLAAQSSVRESAIDPVNDADSNVVGTVRLISACASEGVDRFIFSSTGGAIYGNPDVIPCDEDTPVNPLTPYGLSKRIGELYLELFHRTYGLDYTILRYANVYGPGQDPKGEAGVIAIFAGMMLEGKCPTIFGDGTQERDFVYVSDVVEANIAAIERGNGGTYNIGTGDAVSIGRIYELLQGIIGFDAAASYQRRRPGDVFRIALDPSRAANELSWKPTVPLEQGLEQSVAQLRDQNTRRPSRVTLNRNERRQ